jgi:aryl-alcohol dehydrogenase-like predicted oxidoreductase
VKYVDLGERKASAIGLGVWQFGSREWGWGTDLNEAAARAIVKKALDYGINFFDTAELYGQGQSEEILGHALHGRRDEALIATKVTPSHLTRNAVLEAADRSLARLSMSHVDLYQVHWPNRFVPVSSTMAGMRDLLDQGKVRHVGVSNYPVRLWQRSEKELGRPVIANQVQFHLLNQQPMDYLLPYARRQGRLIIAYSPLAQGVLGGRYDGNELPHDFRANDPMFSRAGFDRVAPVLDELKALGRKYGATPAQIALAWLIHMPNVMAIPGARSPEQVEENALAADIDLTEDEWQELTDIARSVQPETGRRGWKRLAAWVLGA